MKDFEAYNKHRELEFTSTGEKLLYHRDAVKSLRAGKNHPIVLHIMPTEICNLRCVFCSVAQRGAEGKLHSDLTLEQIGHVVGALKPMGLKAVILSGGGEPTAYSKINELIKYLNSENLEIGMITNGTILAEKIKSENFDLLTWIRISINSFDYREDIVVPKLNDKKTALGFSYIWNPLTTEETINRIRQKIKNISAVNNVAYVRLLPDCNLPTERLEEAHNTLRKIAEKLGEPFFHQYKTHATPPECHLGRVHPVFYTDGFIYPCDSLVLNSPEDDKRFHQDFALCRWDKIGDFYSKRIKGSLVDTKKCHHCVFSRQNHLLFDIINTNKEISEVAGEVKHVNFI
jgi:MoaA/NifB/PqqE/SkfB family radical SAM enzyme